MLEAADAPAGDLADLDGDLRRGRGRRVVVLRLEAEDARRLDGSVPGRERRPERHRHFAEDVAAVPVPDHPRQAIEELDDLDVALEHREERPLVSLVDRVVAGSEPDVGGRA